MSKFSGKCDFCDYLFMSAENEQDAFKKFNGTRLYIMQPLPDGVDFLECIREQIDIPETFYKKINYSSIEDLIPYYPYIICFSIGNKDPEKSIVCLSSRSFVDEEEEDLLTIYLERILRYFRKCKRKKILFDIDEVVEKESWGSNKEIYYELAQRVKDLGKKATIEGIHIPLREHYRKELVEEMIKHGVNPKDFGYERFV